MTRIINRKDGYDKEKEKKDLNNKKNAASTRKEAVAELLMIKSLTNKL